jgi:prepilin-type N-terminal cleavage/methylation domain-containing protein
MSSHRIRFPLGFTLVELLVVIGIIALLISMLMPALTKARKSAMSTVCKSQLHQLHVGMVTYAVQNRDAALLGYRLRGTAHEKLTNYFLWDKDVDRYTLLGLLYESRTIQNGKFWACPMAETEIFQYNTPTNPWPPGDPTKHTRSSYGVRPVVPWPESQPPKNLPKLARIRNEAIVADAVSLQSYVVGRHGDGVNVLYGNGAVNWVPREAFEDNLKLLTTDSSGRFTPASNQFFLSDDGTQGVWVDFDRY